MADSTIVVDIVDKSVPELCRKNIAIVNQPNPAIGVTVTGRQLLHLIQFPQYWITESATGNAINGRNIFQYFPDLDPEGGGGGSSKLISKAIDTNGVYVASSEGADGYRTVVVQVPDPVLIDKTITNNGEYNASTDNVDGYRSVNVNVPPNVDEKNITANGTYNATADNVDGYSIVNVDVPPNVKSKSIVANGDYNASSEGADGYSSVTVRVPAVKESDVNFYDYDGTLLYSYTKAEFANLTSFPANPAHDGLTSLGWNWSDLSYAKEQVNRSNSDPRISPGGEYLQIGQMYKVTDGKTRITLRTASRDSSLNTAVYLRLYLNENSNITIEWGDLSTSYSYMSTSSTAAFKIASHKYNRSGVSTITITVTSGSAVIKHDSISGFIYGGVGSSATGVDHMYEGSVFSVLIGDNMSIGIAAFNNCVGLQTVLIPPNDTITEIPDNCFQNCISLKYVTVPYTVTLIGGYIVQRAAVEKISLPYRYGNTMQLSQYSFALTNCLRIVNLPYNTLSVSDYCFYSATILSKVTRPTLDSDVGYMSFASTIIDYVQGDAPSGLFSIGERAFQNNERIWTLNLPGVIKSVGAYAFYNCTGASDIAVGLSNLFTTVEKYTFYGCTAALIIDIYGITYIKDSAFANCTAAQILRFHTTTPPTIENSNVFYGLPTTCKIYVPSSALNTYKNATNYPNPNAYTYIGY